MAGTLDQIQRINDSQLAGMLEAERQVRALAEVQAADARQALYRIAEQFCSFELDAVQRERKAEVQRWTAKQLGEFIVQTLSRRIKWSEIGDQLGELYDAAQVKIDELAQALAGKTRLAEEQAEQIDRLTQELGAVKADLADTRRKLGELSKRSEVRKLDESGKFCEFESGDAPAEKPIRVVPSPGGWFEAWQAAPGFERSRDLLRLLGESGLCRRAELEAQINALWKVTTRHAMDEAAGLLQTHTLIEAFDAPSLGKKGRPPKLLKLTEQGGEAFLLLFGKDPAPSELDELLKRHKTEAHTVLNLEAAGALRARLGATVDMYPSTITLAGGRQFAPDLAATLPHGEVIYVECERGVTPFRESKWQNIYDATGGKLYVICPDTGSRSKVVSAIGKWAGTRAISVSATDLATLGRREDGFWFYSRTR